MANQTFSIVRRSFLNESTAEVTISVGFRPERVILQRVSGTAPGASLDADARYLNGSKKVTAAGVTSFPATSAVTLTEDGFTLGTEADVNAVGVIVFEAWQ